MRIYKWFLDGGYWLSELKEDNGFMMWNNIITQRYINNNSNKFIFITDMFEEL